MRSPGGCFEAKSSGRDTTCTTWKGERPLFRGECSDGLMKRSFHAKNGFCLHSASTKVDVKYVSGKGRDATRIHFSWAPVSLRTGFET